MRAAFIILLALMLASCRSQQRVVEVQSWQHDTVTVERTAAEAAACSDSTVALGTMQSSTVHVTLDTAGRVNTVTRIITRRNTMAKNTRQRVKIVHDTVKIASSSTAASHQKSMQKPENGKIKIIFFIFLALFLCFFLKKTFT